MNIIHKLRSIFKKKCKALSLVEISISLVIIGLLAAGALQGWKFVESTKITNTVNQILQIQTSAQSYFSAHYKKPSAATFWQEVESFGGPKVNEKMLTAIGAEFKIENDKLELAPLNAAQALQIKNALDQNDKLNEGWIKIEGVVDKAGLELNSKEKKYKLIIDY